MRCLRSFTRISHFVGNTVTCKLNGYCKTRVSVGGFLSSRDKKLRTGLENKLDVNVNVLESQARWSNELCKVVIVMDGYGWAIRFGARG